MKPATAFDDLPEDARQALRQGFSRLAGLPPETLPDVLDQALALIDPAADPPGPEELATKCNLDEDVIQKVVGAAIFVATSMFLGQPRLDGPSFLAAARTAGIVPKGSEPAIERFVSTLIVPAQRKILDLGARGESLEALPSFVGLSGAIDLRISSPEPGRHLATPVVVVSLRLSDSPTYFFQMTRRNLVHVRQLLASISEEIDSLKDVWSSPLEE